MEQTNDSGQPASLMQTNANVVVVRGNESSHVVRCYLDIFGTRIDFLREFCFSPEMNGACSLNIFQILLLFHPFLESSYFLGSMAAYNVLYFSISDVF